MELRNLLHIRRIDEFPGRGKLLKQFRDNLLRSSKQRFYIFNIYGEGSVGKTFFLNEFKNVAITSGAFATLIESKLNDIPSVIEKIYSDLKAISISNPILEDHYSTYTRLKAELENDSSITKNITDLIGSNLVNINKCQVSPQKELSRRLDLERISQDQDVKEALKKAIVELRDVISKKTQDSYERELLENPSSFLTLELLKTLKDVAQNKTIVLLFDDYDISKSVLDSWLLDLISGSEFDFTLPENSILAISGQKKLDRELWLLFDSFISDIKLNRFLDSETSVILEHEGIEDKAIKKFAIQLTGGTPLHLKDLVEELRKMLEHGDRINETTVLEKFLSNRKNTINKNLFLDASIPRFINKQVYKYLIGEKIYESSFELFAKLPCLNWSSGEYVYDSCVRNAAIAYRRSTSERKIYRAHKKLIKFYEDRVARIETSNIEANKRPSVPSYTGLLEKYKVELYYHRICADKFDFLPKVTADFFKSFCKSNQYSRAIARCINQAGKDYSEVLIADHGNQLLTLVDYYEKQNFSSLSECIGIIEKDWKWLEHDTHLLLKELQEFFRESNEFDEEMESDSVKSSKESERRNEIFLKLNALPQTQFEQLLFSVKIPPEIVPGPSAPQGNRTYALLTWSESSGGCGLQTISQVLENIINSKDF